MRSLECRELEKKKISACEQWWRRYEIHVQGMHYLVWAPEHRRKQTTFSGEHPDKKKDRLICVHTVHAHGVIVFCQWCKQPHSKCIQTVSEQGWTEKRTLHSRRPARTTLLIGRPAALTVMKSPNRVTRTGNCSLFFVIRISWFQRAPGSFRMASPRSV